MASIQPRRPTSRSSPAADESGLSIGAILTFAGLVGVAAWLIIPMVERASLSPAQRETIETSVHYSGCNEVRGLGKAPLYSGQPGYREGMDGDSDGIACEPYR